MSNYTDVQTHTHLQNTHLLMNTKNYTDAPTCMQRNTYKQTKTEKHTQTYTEGRLDGRGR